MTEIKTSDVYIRFVPFPYHVRACTLPNNDGTFDVYVNSRLDETERNKALEHELRHIKKDHFYDDIKPIEVVEREAI